MLALPAAPEAMATAREAVRGLEAELNGRVGEAELLVTELVTNAIRHPAFETNEITLKMACDGERLEVEVTDGGYGFEPPAAPAYGSMADSGWGLTLLDSLAAGWGVRAEPHTTVWFALDLAA